MDTSQTVLVTSDGLQRLKAELVQARARRIEAADSMKEAAQPGDIEDNPEYEQAKEEVGRFDDRIYELEEMIGRAQVIEERHTDVIEAGSMIEIQDEEGERHTFRVVGAVESDPGAGKISVESPVGRAIVGRRQGDKVTVEVPVGQVEITILSVS
ncbi:MAG: GreA/GreB family elongation factor [Candidatus Dormibacteraeota bacterium]|nr:GreA/GreB family elongation factor [Candidatus Dormibacteraeota bacterium]